MKKLTLVLAVLLMLSAMTASGCVIRDGYYRGHRWHHWR
jgi:hypothetical protein